MDKVLETYKRFFTVVPMGQRAEQLATAGGLRGIIPYLSADQGPSEASGDALRARP